MLWLAMPAAAQVQTLTPVAGRPSAPAFTLAGSDGRTYRLADFRGKVVLVNFWATWCAPCRREMPSMQRLWTLMRGEDFQMVAIDVGEDVAALSGFIAALGAPIEFPVLLDHDASVSDAWPVIGLPTSFLVDRRGRLAYRALGGREWDSPALVDSIRDLMAE
jgi:peroxiredoxin